MLQKLLPFFPPLEPLQSLNLRAALFRYLNQLKQEGVLAKDVILRKSMFDDCKGDKFLELLVAFSAVVLRKVLAEDRGERKSIAAKLCLAEKAGAREHASFLPLALAHRVALKELLRRKAELRARYHKFENTLDVKGQELDCKFDKVVEIQGFLDQNIASEATVSRVAKQFDRHWQGDRRFIDIIAQGEGSPLKDRLLDIPFKDHWSAVSNGTSVSDLRTHRHGLLEDLEQRVATQNKRLQHWKDFKAQMQKGIKSASPSRKEGLLSPRMKSSGLDIEKEKDLVFSPRKSPRKSEWPAKVLSDDSLSVPLPNAPEPTPCRRFPETGGLDLTPVGNLKEDFLGKQRSFIASSLSGSSPKDGNEDSGFLEINGETVLSTTVSIKSTGQNTGDVRSTDFDGSKVLNDGPSSATEQGDSLVDSQGNKTTKNLVLQEDSRLPNEQHAEEPGSRKLNDEEELADQIVTLTLNAPPTPSKPPLSLTERTRQSMAFVSPGANFTAIAHSSSPPVPELKGGETVEEPPTIKGNLLERTRQSISLVPSKPKVSRKSIQNRRSSKIYPTNQFETPRKAAYIKELTPPEELFSPGAGYDSVFRSRPKVASSPTVSPESFIVGMNGFGGDLGSRDVEESPLTRLVAKA